MYKQGISRSFSGRTDEGRGSPTAALKAQMLDLIRAVEEYIEALKVTTSIQADRITQLEKGFCSLEDAKENHDRDKRAKNIVIQGFAYSKQNNGGRLGMRHERSSVKISSCSTSERSRMPTFPRPQPCSSKSPGKIRKCER